MKATPIDWTRFCQLFQNALASGALPDHTHISHDISQGCENPRTRSVMSHKPPDVISPIVNIQDGNARWIDFEVPCRKCRVCLKNRQKLWARRMRHEIIQSNRTWMLTFTINAHHRFMFSVKAGSRDYHESYKLIAYEFTNMVKRLRKAGYKFRYVMVAEAHKDGYPHLHAFFHEVSTPIPKRIIQAEWPYGYTTCKLCDVNAPWYVAKYLAKDARARIRASQGYGQSVRDLSVDILSHLSG